MAGLRCDWRRELTLPVQKNRLEAFSDGVLAIVITIMFFGLMIDHRLAFEGPAAALTAAPISPFHRHGALAAGLSSQRR